MVMCHNMTSILDKLLGGVSVQELSTILSSGRVFL